MLAQREHEDSPDLLEELDPEDTEDLLDQSELQE